MAPRKQSRLLVDPPSASPSRDHGEEEEEEEEEEELEEPQVEDSEEEYEEENEFAQRTTEISKLSHLSQIQPGDEGSEEEEEESETDDEHTKNSSPNASTFIVKPAANKNNVSMEPTKTITKRALSDSEGRKDSSKRTKVTKVHSEKDKDGTTRISGPSGGRIFNPSDVIAILEGMTEYRKQKGVDPHADMGAFLEFMKGRFGFEVTKSQLYEKVRRLKKKFFATTKKGKKHILTNPHDIECFELSKKVWGDKSVDGSVGNIVSVANDRVADNGVDHTENAKIVDGASITKRSAKGKVSEGKLKEKGDKKKTESDKKNKKKVYESNIVEKESVMKDKEDVVKDDEKYVNNYKNVVKDDEQNIPLKYPNLVSSLSIDMTESQRKFMMDGISLVDSEKAKELDDCWKELLMKEAEFYCRKMELMAEQSRLVMDALKKQR